MIHRACHLALCLGFCLCLSLQAQDKSAPPERKANPVRAPIQDVAGLPRVLLIGDSISMGYTLPVRKLLAGKANVHRIPQNGGPSKNGVARLASWLGNGKWDVIHFNHGIHDVKIMPDGQNQVSPADYEANLRTMVTQLKNTGAKLIFALTTPIPDNLRTGPRRFASEVEYNAIATRVMTENGVAINDLYSHIQPRFGELQIPNDLHYKPEGSEFLASRVAEAITSALAR
jgi:hypothetical protein